MRLVALLLAGICAAPVRAADVEAGADVSHGLVLELLALPRALAAPALERLDVIGAIKVADPSAMAEVRDGSAQLVFLAPTAAGTAALTGRKQAARSLREYMAEVNRVLKPDGVLAVAVANSRGRGGAIEDAARWAGFEVFKRRAAITSFGFDPTAQTSPRALLLRKAGAKENQDYARHIDALVNRRGKALETVLDGKRPAPDPVGVEIGPRRPDAQRRKDGKRIDGIVQYFYHSPDSKLPVRDVANKQGAGFKTEPHIEVGAENFIKLCVQANMRFAVENGVKYLFLVTRNANKEMADYFGRQFVVGTIRVERKLEQLTEDGKRFVSILGKTKIVPFEQAVPVKDFPAFGGQHLNRARINAYGRLNPAQTRSLLRRLERADNVTQESIAEVVRLDPRGVTWHGSEIPWSLRAKGQPLLSRLVDQGLLARAIERERAQRIGAEGSVNTLPTPIDVPLLHDMNDLEQVDREMSGLVGARSWERLKALSSRLMDARDRIANDLALSPEGIHPVFAFAAGDLLKAVSGEGHAGAAAGDETLARAIAQAPRESLPTVDVYLRQMRLSPGLAPRAHAALARRLDPLPEELAGFVETLPSLLAASESKAQRERADRRLARKARALPAGDLLRLQGLLVSEGLLDDRLTLYGWRAASGLLRSFPRTVEAMSRRDVRAELIHDRLTGNAAYRAASREYRRALAEAVRAAAHPAINELSTYLSKIPASSRPAAAAALTEWALLQDQKLRAWRGETAAPARGDLKRRPIAEVIFDHLRLCRKGDRAGDKNRNYSDKVVMTTNQGNFFGFKGIGESIEALSRVVRGTGWSINRISVLPGPSPREGTVIETWSADSEGTLLTAVANFYVKDGKVLMHSAYYAEPPASAKLDGPVEPSTDLLAHVAAELSAGGLSPKRALRLKELRAALEKSAPSAKRYKIIFDGKEYLSTIPGRYAGWRQGKIFGTLDCESGKAKIKEGNRVFFLSYEDALAEGYRPCKVCKPKRR